MINFHKKKKPLTNVGKALTQKPELAAWVDHVYLMGGTFGHPGNISPSAEVSVCF